MQYAISYVSTAAPSLSISEVEAILKMSTSNNNNCNITGILLYSSGNFFQVLEGEKEAVNALFEKIAKDERHYDLIPVFKKEIRRQQFKEYESDFLSLDSAYRNEDIDLYMSHINKLDPSIQNSVKYILDNFS